MALGMEGKVTKTAVERIVPAERDTFLWDTELSGFGVKVTPKGKRVYLLQYWNRGRTIRYTIAPHGVMTPDEARREAQRLKGEVAAGRDPAEARRQTKVEAAQIETFASVVDEFIKRDQMPRNRSWRTVERRLQMHVVPRWGRRDVQTVMHRDVIKLLDDLRDEIGPAGANKVFSVLRRLFNWALDREIVPVSPLARVKAPAREVERERVLSDQEVRAFWLAAKEIGSPFGPFMRFLLITAQRRSEAANVRWSDIDLEAKVWHMPAAATKSGRSHDVPLSSLALEILEEIGRSSTGDFVFSTTGGQRAISGFSKAKMRLEQKAELLKEAKIVDVLLRDWRLHDLRRTAATAMARCGVPVSTISRVLNHAEGGVTRIYDRHSYFAEKRRALESWAQMLAKIVAPTNENVTVTTGK